MSEVSLGDSCTYSKRTNTNSRFLLACKSNRKLVYHSSQHSKPPCCLDTCLLPCPASGGCHLFLPLLLYLTRICLPYCLLLPMQKHKHRKTSSVKQTFAKEECNFQTDFHTASIRDTIKTHNVLFPEQRTPHLHFSASSPNLVPSHPSELMLLLQVLTELPHRATI